jgi:hypothetical protein
MKPSRAVFLLSMSACLLVCVIAPVAHGFGIAKWEAGTCNSSAGCEYSNRGNFYTQAAGHPAWGLTGFEVTGASSSPALKRIRVDIPPGLAADPVTLPSCSSASFEANSCPAETKAGIVELKAYVEIPGAPETIPLKGNVYSLGERAGLPLLFGIDVEGVKPVVKDVHLILEGHVSDTHEGHAAPSGDDHEYFEINNIPSKVSVEVEIPLLGGVKLEEAGLKTVESKLFFNGHAGRGNFLTLPSVCSSTTTSYLELESYGGEHASAITHSPVGVTGCDGVPFSPTATVKAENSQYDATDGAETLVQVPQKEASGEINTADIDNAHVTLPEGMTLNPSAAHGLEACTQAQLAKGLAVANSCPAASKIGTVEIETDLPPHSLTGTVYLGRANGTGLLTGPPYLIFIDAESVFGVTLRLEGQAVPNPTTGRLEVSFLGNPQLPFSSLSLKLNGGPRAPLANPLTCAAASTGFTFSPWTGAAPFNSSTPFTTTGCPAHVPFTPTQATADSSTRAGAFTSYTFSLQRTDSQKDLGSVHAVLPAGLVGFIPSVPRCPEPLANAGRCPVASAIGSATASAGVGPEPYGFSGPVYLTGPTGGAPYGLSIPIEAAAGPFDLGRVTTRVALSVDPDTARVEASSTLPRIVGGVPLRLRSLSVAIDRSDFLFNPSYCGALTTDSTLAALDGTPATASSPFKVTDCTSLPFKPVFTASSPTAPSRADGASLEVGFTQPGHQANIKSVVTSLPTVLPSRDSTLKLACPEKTFRSGYRNCPKTSRVGSASVTTPVLPEKLTGPAYLVSHGGAGFPDLDLFLEGDGGVHVDLVGNTEIAKGITTSTFASVPDVPVSSFLLSLPTGRDSLLGAGASLCAKPLYMPTTITAQSGAVIKQRTRISIGSCKIKLLSHRVRGRHLILRVETYTAGRVSVTSPALHTTYRHLKGPAITTIKVPLSRRGRRALASGRRLHIRVRVGFNPLHKDEYHSAAFAHVTFRH